MAKAVQFKGKTEVMKAFVNIEQSAWAVIWDKQLLHKCAGQSFAQSEGLLREFLSGLEKSNTTTVYELRIFEDITDRKKIKLSTEADFSYNFILFDQEDYPAPGTITRREGYSKLQDSIDLIHAEIALIKAKGEEEEEDDDSVGAPPPPSAMERFFNKILETPKVEEAIGEVFTNLIQGFTSNKSTTMENKQIAGMGNVNQDNQDSPIKEITQENVAKIQQAVEILAGLDPDFGDNLMRIAQLAQSKPAKYKTAINMLNTFL